MEIENSVNDDINTLGVSSQKKGRFIIQEIDEESNKSYLPNKKYSFDENKIIL